MTNSSLQSLLLNQEQPMDFAHFMELALYHPKSGYYQQNKIIIGSNGDFTTAPEVSPIFSLCLANAIHKQATTIAKNLSQCSILELGAGRGTMAYDLLLQLNQLESLPKNYQILELSEALMQQQKTKLQQLPKKIFNKISWVTTLPSADSRIILANEVVDALPLNIGVIKKIHSHWQWCEKKVLAKKINGITSFEWHQCEPQNLPDEIDPSYCQENRVFEYPKQLSNWLSSLNSTVDSGLLFIIDYAERDKNLKITYPNGTLRTYKRHRVGNNPLKNIGEQDITAQVNIDLLVNEANKCQWQLTNLQTQVNFLMDNGLSDLAIPQSDNIKRFKIAQEITQLTMPNKMGEAFKVMVFKKTKKPKGF